MLGVEVRIEIGEALQARLNLHRAELGGDPQRFEIGRVGAQAGAEGEDLDATRIRPISVKVDIFLVQT